ncbi:hypothetical protein [Solidesulfovibrio sp. C21]|uniref:hypothetical protein n=1 Tax=Solidesulfovibrio sp. C21 TaxID=3398613 RepID=UPI0039FC6C38
MEGSKPIERDEFFKQLDKIYKESSSIRVSSEIEARKKALRVCSEAASIMEFYDDHIPFAQIVHNDRKNGVVSLTIKIEGRVCKTIKVSGGSVFVDQSVVLEPDDWDKDKFEAIIQETAIDIAKHA